MTTPRSTYRVQVRPGFDLDDTADILDYLRQLGVSHLYTSPLLAATPGSQHGYDVVDHTRVGAQIGAEPARRRLADALRRHGMGLVVDIVPNHMGVEDAAANRLWWDVLALGPQSVYSRFFDIDWSRGRVLLPVLGDSPDELDRLRLQDGELRYYEHRFPLAAGTTPSPRRPAEVTAQQVHDRQHYELVSWRRASADLNYRRFFAISTLAGIRAEDPVVFAESHREVLRWAAEGDLDGLRIDHPDGLGDPGGYLERLAAAAPTGTWIVVEKILGPGESLPPTWRCAGTTGYDALALVDGVLVDPAGAGPLRALAAELTGPTPDWPALVRDRKRAVATGIEQSEVRRLAEVALVGIDATDTNRTSVRAAIAELLARFPVYRSYLPAYGVEHLDSTLGSARDARPDLAPAFDLLGPRLHDPADELAIRFQQQTGAVTAKAVEDCAYYRYTPFVAANEVGGDPGRIGLPTKDFHAALRQRQDAIPDAMTALSTHDTKRSEDVRARLAVLAEVTDEWTGVLRRLVTAAPLPDGSLANLLWQTVAGTWPIERERLHAYAEKAARESGASTGWDQPDAAFEASVRDALDHCYDDPAVRAVIEDFTAAITPYGWSNSLAAKLISLTMPGVPDVYQGTELFDNSLVDPDNRRPVDFAARHSVLTRIDAGELPPIGADGAAKLLVSARALRLRRDRPELFTTYRPLVAAGPASEHVIAFDRGGAVTIVTRLPVALDRGGGWQASTLDLPAGDWVDILTRRPQAGGPRPMAELAATYPVALLARH
ncbi:MAG: malto-oligosyltrehalose synthase [Mycobacteriales bacterium]